MKAKTTTVTYLSRIYPNKNITHHIMSKRKTSSSNVPPPPPLVQSSPTLYANAAANDDNVKFQLLTQKLIEHTQNVHHPFSIPIVADALQASRNELYRICSVLVDLSLMLQVNTTTFKWASTTKDHYNSGNSDKSTSTSSIAEKNITGSTKRAKKNPKSEQEHANTYQIDHHQLLTAINELEDEDLSLDIYLAAAHHTFNTFVNYGDNKKYGCLFQKDFNTFMDTKNQIGFAIHGPADSRLEVPHPDDHIVVHSGNETTTVAAASLPPRRYQLYLMSRDGPFSINYFGQKMKSRNEISDERGIPRPRGRLYGEPVLSLPPSKQQEKEAEQQLVKQNQQQKDDGNNDGHYIIPVNTTTLRRDQYSVYQLPEWNKLELNETVPRSEWQKAHTKWT